MGGVERGAGWPVWKQLFIRQPKCQSKGLQGEWELQSILEKVREESGAGDLEERLSTQHNGGHQEETVVKI